MQTNIDAINSVTPIISAKVIRPVIDLKRTNTSNETIV